MQNVPGVASEIPGRRSTAASVTGALSASARNTPTAPARAPSSASRAASVLAAASSGACSSSNVAVNAKASNTSSGSPTCHTATWTVRICIVKPGERNGLSALEATALKRKE
jgi:hypothetical protein